MIEKWCTACKARHPREAFGMDANRGDGLRSACRASRHVPRRSMTQRFEEKTRRAPNGCIEWTGSLTGGGYGHLWVGGRGLVLAHRLAWEMARGPIPAEGGDCRGICVCHRCDNRSCVNVEHLFLGSHLDNMKDMDAKGRRVALAGADNPRAKLTPEQVAEIRRWKGKFSQRVLGRMFGVSKNTIAFIHRGQHWRQFPEVTRG